MGGFFLYYRHQNAQHKVCLAKMNGQIATEDVSPLPHAFFRLRIPPLSCQASHTQRDLPPAAAKQNSGPLHKRLFLSRQGKIPAAKNIS